MRTDGKIVMELSPEVNPSSDNEPDSHSESKGRRDRRCFGHYIVSVFEYSKATTFRKELRDNGYCTSRSNNKIVFF